jgi:hypothetical protein
MKSILKKINLILLIVFTSSLYSQGKVISVPADYATIQEGINNSENGDTILVSPNTYYENINFMGKNIVVSSFFILAGNPDYIKNTIIDGSQAVNPDSASCVFFCSGEDSTAVIEGFTLTKGKGTRYLYPNGWFREGGGVFVNNSKPTIKNNLIIGNEVLNTSNVTSAGGGGIRSNLGNPHIYNNVIMLNKALFGAAIVLDNSNGIVKNNIIYKNTGASSYGGGGAFWMYGVNCKVTIENNTILANSLGGIFVQVVETTISNNIIWGNDSYQIGYSNGFGNTELTINNNDIEGAYAGNMGIYPVFKDSLFFLDTLSPLVDAGIDNELYNDIENGLNPGNALWPSLGNVRNDIGAYGGPDATILPSFEFFTIAYASVNFGTNDTIGKPVSKKFILVNQSTTSAHIDSLVKTAGSPLIIKYISDGILSPVQSDTISFEWTPQNDLPYKDSLMIFHSLKNIANPLIVHIRGQAGKLTSLKDNTTVTFVNIYPNPFKKSAIIQYKGLEPNSRLDIIDLNGRTIKSVRINDSEGNIALNRNEMSPGIYLYLLKSESLVLTGKFLIYD